MRVTDKFEVLNGKYKDPRTRRYLTPTRIVKTFGHVTGAENLLSDNYPQVAMRVNGTCALENKTGEPCAAILIDFGIEFSGSLRIFTHSCTVGGKNCGVNVRIRLGESVGEALTPAGERGACNDHANRDQIMNLQFWSGNETPESGYRFAYIELLGENSRLELQKIFGVFTYRDLEYKGSFESSDPLLNRIWNTSAYTAHLCMQEYMWDGIKRDRLVWIGDMHPEVTTALAVFGDCDVIERSLDVVRDETPTGEWMNHISTYSLWWVMVHCDLYRSTGNKEYLKEQREKMCEILSRAADLVDENGSETMPEKRLLDWPNEANEGAKHAGIHALLKMTLEKGGHALFEIGEDALAEKCRDTAERMCRHVPDPCGSKQAAALLAISGLGDAKRLNDEIIGVDGARRFSTFFSYYLLEAKAMAGDYDGALDAIREYYGGMLKMGATTFWEDFDLDWMENSAPIDEIVPKGMNDIHGDFGAYCYKNFRHSLCHGWASGPCPYLSHYVLGIRPINATTYKIEPNLASLKWAKGSYPTVKGIITVSAEKTANGIKVEYTAPEGIKIVTN
ncbi:MAG: alpha-L-rhamnosidase, partial [Clostridia bacterium]|nr:alpha-L-rhamnosidase [Clostridia bacterium]